MGVYRIRMKETYYSEALVQADDEDELLRREGNMGSDDYEIYDAECEISYEELSEDELKKYDGIEIY